MKKLGGIVTTLLVAGLLTAAASAPLEAAARAGRNSFDGSWSVLISTSYGGCGTYRAALQIVGGRVVSESQDYTASGYVSASGATAVTVASNAGSATGYGRLRGRVGRWAMAFGGRRMRRDLER